MEILLQFLSGATEPFQITSNRTQLRYLISDVVDDLIVSSHSRCSDRDVLRQLLKNTLDATIIRAEVVTLIGDAVRFVHDEHPEFFFHRQQDFFLELSVRQSLW